MLLRRLLLACACSLFCLPVLPAQAAAPFELGLQDDGVLLYGNPFVSRERGLDYMQQLGAGSVRINVIWTRALADQGHGTTAPATSIYDWSPYDAAVNAIRARGLRVQLTVSTPAPAWATRDHKRGANGPNPQLFARFSADVATHFRGRVRSLSVMNEPNWPTWLTPKQLCKGKGRKRTCHNRASDEYRAIYQQTFTAVKRAVPNMEVWFGELAPQAKKTKNFGAATSPLLFMREVLCVTPGYRKKRCAGLRTDGVAMHPYYLNGKPTSTPRNPDDLSVASLSRLNRALSRFEQLGALRAVKGRALPVYLTEFGYLVKGSRAVSAGNHGPYLRQAILMARRTPRVRQLLLYQLVDGRADEQWHSGIISAAGKPKPAFSLLRGLVGGIVPRPAYKPAGTARR